MRSLAVRLIALVAVMLLPLGMATAPAEAHQQHSTMTMSIQHCADESSEPKATGARADCTMPCATALPAHDLGPIGSGSFSRSGDRPAAQLSLADIALEIATPPPRFS
jgi:hypothetical protein